VGKTLAYTLLVAATFGVAPARAASPEAPLKIDFIYGSYGNGHKTTAENLAARLQNAPGQRPISIRVIDSVDYMPRFVGESSKRAFELVTQRAPEVYEFSFRQMLESELRLKSSADSSMVKPYDLLRVAADIQRRKPDLIVATISHAAQLALKLRALGLIPPEIKIVWQHTDYSDHPAFRKLAQEVDLALLPHEDIKQSWLASGEFRPDQLQAVGLPVHPDLRQAPGPHEKADLFKAHGFDPAVRTIFVTSGANGVGNYREIVRGLAKAFPNEPLQILAATGRNEHMGELLEELKSELPPNLKLAVIRKTETSPGVIPAPEFRQWIRNCDLIITKAGGLTSSELIAAGKPVVFLDINGGQERDNIAFFEQRGLGKGVRKERDAGLAARRLLNDPRGLKRLQRAQAKFEREVGPDNPALLRRLRELAQASRDAEAWDHFKPPTLPIQCLNAVRNFFH
jgi:processive 1,2-diacylglycerol beta-glucosyltransferase